MTIEDPRSGRKVFYWRDPFNFVKYGTRVKCGNAFYLHKDQIIRWWQDFERLEIVR